MYGSDATKLWVLLLVCQLNEENVESESITLSALAEWVVCEIYVRKLGVTLRIHFEGIVTNELSSIFES